MAPRDQNRMDRYTWLPHAAVRACIRLSKRHEKKFQEARHFMIDVAAFISIMSHPSRGLRRTDQDVLDALTLVAEMQVLVEASEERLLREARRRGITFREIADAMSMRSRQAAEQRFIRLAGGKGEAEQNHMNRRRQARFGYVVDAQEKHENHLMNLNLAFRWIAFDADLPEEVAQDPDDEK